MNKVFKAHPLMLFSFLKPTLITLFLPVVKGTVQYFTERNFKGVAGFFILVLFVIISAAVLRWRSYSLLCNKNDGIITVKYGILFKKFAKIDIYKLSSVQTTQNPIDLICHAVTFKINTEAGSRNRTDFEFKLSLNDSKEVSALLYGNSEPKIIKFSALKVAILAATTSSAFTGMLVAVPVINRAGNLLGIGLSAMLFNGIDNIGRKVKTYFPPVVHTLTLVILAAYFVSFVYLLFKYVNFELFLGKDNLGIRSGLIVRTRTEFKKSAINNIRVEQTLLMQLFRRYALKVSVGGYGNSKSKSEIVIPLGGNKEIKDKMAKYFSFFMPDGEEIRPARNYFTQSRYLFMPALYFVLTVAVSVLLVVLFSGLKRFIFFLTVIVCLLILGYAYMGLFQYKKSQISFGNNIFARSNKGFHTCELYCSKENMGEIRIIRLWADVWHNTCRVRIFVRSERADNICVRHLDYKTVKTQIYKCFNIE